MSGNSNAFIQELPHAMLCQPQPSSACECCTDNFANPFSKMITPKPCHPHLFILSLLHPGCQIALLRLHVAVLRDWFGTRRRRGDRLRDLRLLAGA